MSRRRIFLMRHGSVSYFDESGAPVHPESVPLNTLGRKQASAAGQIFAQAGQQFDRVIVSGLPRTVETAQRVLAETGQAIELEVWPELSEIRGGKLADIPDEQLAQAFTGSFDGVVPESALFLGGESIGALLDRVHPAVARLRSDASWDTVLLVLHEGVNRAILSYALTGQRSFLGGLAQTPACINALDVGAAEHDWVLRFANFAPPAPLHQSARHTTMEGLLAAYQQFRKK